MKVYYSHSMYEGCNYVRCLLPTIYNGWDGDKTSLRDSKKDAKTATQAMLHADIIVMQRPFEKARKDIFNALKEAGKKIVFDNDDSYKVNDQMKLGETLEAVSNSIDWFIENSDLVTTTTEFLAEEYRKLNPNVVVLPNMIDPADWDTPKRNKGDKVRIGLVGSTLMNKDFESIIPTLKVLSEQDNIELVILGMPKSDMYKQENSFWSTLNVEINPPVPVYEYADAVNDLKLDIMLIPREDTYFNRCKSNLKFLEASMLEIPVIAQGFIDGLSPYQVNKDDAKHMIIVTDNNKWLSEIDKLVNDKNLRRKIGKEAKKYVLKNYDIDKKAYLWEEAYYKIYG